MSKINLENDWLTAGVKLAPHYRGIVDAWAERGWRVILEYNGHRPASEAWSCEVVETTESNPLPGSYIGQLARTLEQAIDLAADEIKKNAAAPAPAPRCPKCGAEMGRQTYPDDGSWWCPSIKCGHHEPAASAADRGEPGGAK
jgi:hypothetical protein